MLRKITTLLVAVALSLTAFAASKYPDISHDELKAAMAAGTVTLIDVNGSQSYAKGHIPGAMDFAALKDSFAAKLPADKSALVVAYCGSPSCGAYKKAADAAVALGYTNVKHYSGGISGWQKRGEQMGKL
ncbi:MAG: sulfurtransferase [Opitutus sp.]|nr:sulfurtransferase [Opitutus sp.]